MRKNCALSCLLVLARVVFGDVTPGAWSSDFVNSEAFAKAQRAPLVVFWGNKSCQYCNAFSKVRNDVRITDWLKDHPAVMVFKHDSWDVKKYGSFSKWRKSWSDDFRAAAEWIEDIAGKKMDQLEWPCVCIVWDRPDGTRLEKIFCARDGAMPSKTPVSDVAGQFRDSLDLLLSDYRAGLGFAVGRTGGDRLEAAANTAYVDVGLKRNGGDGAVQSVLTVTFPNGETQSHTNDWEIGEYDKTVRVTIPEEAFELGKNVELIVSSDDGAAAMTSLIAMTEPVNSPKNPCWFGERTIETLEAGEWTMDYDLVRARAAAKGKPALVLVGGSLWCPDCVKTDHYLVETPEFREWLLSNDVSCAAIDVPNVAKEGMNTSLLTYEPFSTSDRYVNATTPKQDRVQSGAGYRSRHMIPQEGNGGTNATAVAVRNLMLINEDTDHGGLCRPENMGADNLETGPFKTGIPCLIVLRPDGTVAGRLYQFNNVSPGDTKALTAYINRMNELVDLCDDVREEDNADWRTTKDGLQLADGVTAGISAMDLADWYLLQTVEHTAEGEIIVGSAAVPADKTMKTEQNVSLTLYRVGEDGTNAVKTVKGNLFAGVTMPVTVEPDGAKRYVAVRAIDTSKTFAITRKDVSTTEYTLTADVGYRESTATFEKAAMTVNEKTAGTLRISVLREGGGAGELRAKVVLDEGATTAAPYSYEWTDRELAWEDGDVGPQTVELTVLNDSLWDGTRTIALKVVEVGGDFVKETPLGPTGFVATVTEDDKKAVGKLAITATDPHMAKSMTTIVREGTVLDIGVERLSGASSAVTTEVVAAKGVLSSNLLAWANNDLVAMKHVALEVPMLAELGKSTSFKVSLKPRTGIKADAKKKALTVGVVAADAPGFEVAERYYPIRRYVAFSDEIGVSNWHGGRLVLKKTSGSLPSGVKAKLVLDGGVVKLVLSGVPTKAKDCSAVYRVSEERPKADPTKVGTVAGTTVKLVFSVSEITKEGKDGQAANPFVAKSHTFSDVAIVDAGVLAGKLTVTVPQSGKVSAKYLCRAGTVSFSASSWESCDSATGELSAVLKPKTAGYALSVRVAADGVLTYAIDDEILLTDVVEGTATVAPWNKTTKLAAAWKGYYTVDCPATNLLRGVEGRVPSGDAWFTLKMTSSSAVYSGKMTYAGRLPNGVSFSGSCILTDWGETAGLPVVCRSAADYFTAYVEIAANAAAAYSAEDEHRCMLAVEGVEPRWIHDEAKSAEDCLEVGYGLYGAYYDAREDIEYCARRKFPGVQLLFAAGGAIREIPFNVTAAKPYIDKYSPLYEGNPNALTLSFNRSTGIVHGTFKFVPPGGTATVKATYYGVLLPGWGGCGTCKPGETFRPLFAGSFWYAEALTKKISVKRGGAFGIGEGEAEGEGESNE